MYATNVLGVNEAEINEHLVKLVRCGARDHDVELTGHSFRPNARLRQLPELSSGMAVVDIHFCLRFHKCHAAVSLVTPICIRPHPTDLRRHRKTTEFSGLR